MPWSDPANHVWTVGELVTAANMNTYIKDNLIDVDRRASFKGGSVEATEQTTSTSYTDLTTVGPQVSIDVGQTGEIVVNMYAALANLTANNATFMSFAITGATTRAAADNFALAWTPGTNGRGARYGAAIHVFALNPGIHTVTAKYRVSGGTGDYTNRRITVVPFGA